jgi:hypothetical protein
MLLQHISRGITICSNLTASSGTFLYLLRNGYFAVVGDYLLGACT